MAWEWGVESLRVSLFSNAPTVVTDEDWRAVSNQTEQYNHQVIVGGHIFSGNVNNGQLNLAAMEKRVDIILTSIPTTSTSEARLPTIGPWEQVRDRFVAFTSAWMETASFSVVRIAFGAVLLCPTSSRQQSYTLLQRMLRSVSVNPDKMRELFFRVNWPTNSGTIDGLLINRITNWSAIEFLVAKVELGASPSATAGTQGYAVRLELDHNTDLSHTDRFSPDQVQSIYQELIAAASDNALKGECP
jgi:hypothetical protein